MIDFINKNRAKGKVSIIFFLIVQNSIELLKLVLGAGTKFPVIDEIDDQGRGAIHIAAICGHNKVIKMLIDAGNNISLQDNNGNTALDYAKKY